MLGKKCLFALACIAAVCGGRAAAAPGADPGPARALDLSTAVIVVPPNLAGTQQKAVTVLREEFQKRTGIALEQTTAWPDSPRPVIALGLLSQSKQFAGPFAAELEKLRVPGPEGFVLMARQQPRPAVLIVAADSRGLLYGIGRLLRNMEWAPQTATVPAGLHIASAPKYPLRGHQLGYRPINNTYSAWTEAQFDQYIRELALFGSNSIEILPPGADDAPAGPQTKVPPLEMMERLSAIIDSYGLDVWVWYPNLAKDYNLAQPARHPGEDKGPFPPSEPVPTQRQAYLHWREHRSVNEELAEREEVFRRLPRIDYLLVPGGDPGEASPEVLFPWLDRVAAVLHKYHPRAKIWLSPQGFIAWYQRRLDAFYKHVNESPTGWAAWPSRRGVARPYPRCARSSTGTSPSGTIPISRTTCTADSRFRTGTWPTR